MTGPRKQSEAERLENLWSGSFGDDYLRRNATAGELRGAFWGALLDEFPISRVLEIGCNAGPNLQWFMPRCEEVFGVDINRRALALGRRRLPTANLIHAEARRLPLRDGWFDLAFTAGVLIHQPQRTLPLVMSELVRVSRRFVLAIEYDSDEVEEVTYHGQRGALFKQDYGALYLELFLELRLLRSGKLSRAEGWDDVTFWLLERS